MDHGQPLAQPTLDLDLKNEKHQRLDAERDAVERAVASAKFDTIQERVAWVLNHYPETRNSDIALQLKYWERFEPDLYPGGAIEPADMYKLTRGVRGRNTRHARFRLGEARGRRAGRRGAQGEVAGGSRRARGHIGAIRERGRGSGSDGVW
jgi:hypothetical protein